MSYRSGRSSHDDGNDDDEHISQSPQESNEKSPVWEGVKSVAPYVAVASLGAAVFGMATLLQKSMTKKETIDHALDNFSYILKNMGDSTYVKTLIRIGLISPQWRLEYFVRLEQHLMVYHNFHVLLATAEDINNVANQTRRHTIETVTPSKTARVHQDYPSPRQLIQWRGSALKLLVTALKSLQDCMNIRNMLNIHSAQICRLTRAFNIYWSGVEATFLADANKAGDAKGVETIVQKKMTLVKSIMAWGLDPLLRVSAGKSSAEAQELSKDLGSANEHVTSHVTWWLKMHCILPTMSCIITDDAFGAGRSKGARKLEATDGLSKPSDGRKHVDTHPTSPLIDQWNVWKRRVKGEGIMSVVVDPWDGFQPCPGEEAYIPRCKIETRILKESLAAVFAKIDYNMSTMIQCTEAISKALAKINVCCADIIVHCSRNNVQEKWQDENLDDKEFDEIVAACETRRKVIESVWNLMTSK